MDEIILINRKILGRILKQKNSQNRTRKKNCTNEKNLQLSLFTFQTSKQISPSIKDKTRAARAY